jgi:hypothetical protein
LARWYAGTTWKLAGQSYELEGRLDLALKAYTEGVRLNSEDVLAQIRLERLRQVLARGGSAGSASDPRAGADAGKPPGFP